MRSVFESASTARFGATRKNSAAPPANGSKYLPMVAGSRAVSSGRSLVLPPTHLMTGEAVGARATEIAAARPDVREAMKKSSNADDHRGQFSARDAALFSRVLKRLSKREHCPPAGQKGVGPL